MFYSETALVNNYPNGYDGTNIQDTPPYYYRCRNCDTNLTSNTPANQYQRQKLIQNTVRVPSSLYTMNLGSLNAYTKPTAATYNVCWNQMSDRPIPSVQKAYVPTGHNNSLNGRHSSVTSSRPGGQSPGGVGCDIKHNSYDRYLNRLKGKGPVRRGVVPTGFGVANIPFNVARPIYGGKVMKTSIVNNCNCPITDRVTNINNDRQIFYNNAPVYTEPTCQTYFKLGDFVYAQEVVNGPWIKAQITAIDETTSTYYYSILFEDGTTKTGLLCNQLYIYFPCDCTIYGQITPADFIASECFIAKTGQPIVSVSDLFNLLN